MCRSLRSFQSDDEGLLPSNGDLQAGPSGDDLTDGGLFSERVEVGKVEGFETRLS